MNKIKQICIALLVIGIAVTGALASEEVPPSSGETQGGSEVIIDLSPLTEMLGSIAEGIAAIPQTITDIPGNTSNWLQSRAEIAIANQKTLFGIIAWNPTPEQLHNTLGDLHTKVVGLIAGIFLLGLIFYGIKFTAEPLIEQTREKSKKSLTQLGIGIVCVLISSPLYNMIILTESALISYLITPDSLVQVFEVYSFSGVFMTVLLTIANLGVLLIMMLRNILVMIGYVLFPLAIALASIPFTEKYGKFFLNIIGIAIFSQALEGLIIAGVLLTASTTMGEGIVDQILYKFVFSLALLTLLILAPVILVLIALLETVSLLLTPISTSKEIMTKVEPVVKAVKEGVPDGI